MNINSAIIHGAKVLKNNLIKNPYLDSEILMTKAIKKDQKIVKLKLGLEIGQNVLELTIFHKVG